GVHEGARAGPQARWGTRWSGCARQGRPRAHGDDRGRHADTRTGRRRSGIRADRRLRHVTPRRISIVYGRVGGGHLSAAQALRAALLDAAPGRLEVELADAYGTYARAPVSWFPAGYANVVRNHPRFWSLFFASTQVSGMRFGGD